ncbi:MAG: hypothetical protein Q9218_006877 [Villophora microphyllina]
MAPNRPSQSPPARSTRITRSQTRELSDSEADRLGTKRGRGRSKQHILDNTKASALQEQKPNKGGPNPSNRARPLGDVPEVDEDSRISYPSLPRTVAVVDELTSNQLDGTRRKDIRDVRSSGNSSVFSGTTARTSRSGPELSNTLATDMVDSLEDLSAVSDKIIRLIIPQNLSEATVQSIRDRLSDPKSRESRQLKRQNGVYRTQRKGYGDGKFIQIDAIVRALLDTSSYANDNSGAWRMDPVLYKANLTDLIIASVTSSDDGIAQSMNELNRSYPAPFLHRFVDAADVERSPNSSALLMETFRLALDIRTYSFVGSAKRDRDDPGFDPDQLLQRVFYRDSNTVMGWEVAGLRFDDLRQKPQLKNAILNRLDQLRGTFSEGVESHIDLRGLEGHFSRSWLTTSLVQWCQLRLQEIETQLKAVEGASGIVQALQSVLAGNEELSPSSNGRSVAAEYPKYGFQSPKARKTAVSRLKELEARRASQDFKQSSTNAAMNMPSLSHIPPMASTHTPVQTATTSTIPATAPAKIRGTQQSPSHLVSSPQLPPIGDDDDPIIPGDTGNIDASEVADMIIQTQEAIEDKTNKENLKLQPQPTKKRQFLDHQENAERVPWEDTQDTAPASTAGQSVVEATQNPRSDGPSSPSEDGGFQQDTRPIAQRRRPVPSATKRRPLAELPLQKRPRVVPPSQGTTETDELSNAVARHNDVNAPPLSQVETYQLTNRNAKLLVAKQPKPPRSRTFWSEDEVERLLDLIQEFGTSWSLLEKLDTEYPDGARLAGRNQYAIKDKAMNMKVDYLTALGFSNEQPDSRGLPYQLRLSLKSFIQEWSWITDDHWVTDLFLAEEGEKIFQHSDYYPNLPEDRAEVSELLSRAFSLLRGYAGLTDSSDTSESEARVIPSRETLPPEIALQQPIPTGYTHDNDFKEDEPAKHNTSNPHQSTAAEANNNVATCQTFKSFQSKIEVVHAVNEWINSHSQWRVPVLSRHDQDSLEHNFAMEATLVDSGDRVWICRVGVVDKYQGWVLEQPNGCYVLVKSHYTRKDGHAYYPWIGGDDFAFGSDMMANHNDCPKVALNIKTYARKRGLDAEDVLNEHDISLRDLKPDSPVAAGESSAISPKIAEAHGEVQEMSTSSLTSLTDSDSFEAQEAYPVSPRTRRKWFPLDMRLYGGRDSSADLLDISTKNLSRTAGRSRVSKPQPKRRPKAKSGRRPLLRSRTASKLAGQPIKSEEQEPSLSYTRALNTKCPEVSDPFSTSGPVSNGHGLGLESPFAASRTWRPTMYPTPPDINTPYFRQDSPAPVVPYFPPMAPSFQKSIHPAGTTTFHFYLSNPSLGAIPKPYSSITSKERFFKEATAAYQLLPATDNTAGVIAASVVIIGINRPIVIRKDAPGKSAWDELKKVIGTIEKGGNGAELEVTCITGQ